MRTKIIKKPSTVSPKKRQPVPRNFSEGGDAKKGIVLAGKKLKGTKFPEAAALPRYNVEKIRKDFPILREKIHGKPLVYLDNAATTQKPLSVIQTLERYYSRENSNIHRGLHLLSEKATEAYEGVREKTRKFLNAADTREIIFTRGATEGINLVAQTWGRQYVGAGDEIIVTVMEHHSNIVPWQMLCGEKGALLKVAPINEAGELVLDELKELFTPNTKLLALTHVSNALGTVNPVEEIIRFTGRPGWACYTESTNCWMKCLLTRAEGT